MERSDIRPVQKYSQVKCNYNGKNEAETPGHTIKNRDGKHTEYYAPRGKDTRKNYFKYYRNYQEHQENIHINNSKVSNSAVGRK